jgi:uncharacterized protein (TIGR03437 family)
MESQAWVRRYLVAGLFVLVSFCNLQAQIVSFIPLFDLKAGFNPSSLVVADFNGDGRPDVAVTDETSGKVFVFLGAGNGLFLLPLATDVGLSPQAIAAGDFNNDGRLDLVVANSRSNTISILLGLGNGFFLAPINIDTLNPSFVAVGDFNNDGRPDIAVSNASSGAVSIFLGLGNGFFGVTFSFAVGPHPGSIAVGDFNGDGRLDLAVATFGNCSGCIDSNTVSILLGIGNGTFIPALAMLAGENPASVAAGDFNHDGKLDLAVANATPVPGTVSILPNVGNGFFQFTLAFSVETNPTFLVAGDFNLDGELDLAVANTASNTISVLQGLGNGIFAPGLNFLVGAAPVWIGVADLNTDGKPDLLVANRSSGTVSVLLNATRTPSRPVITSDSVLSGASFRGGPVAPGEIVTIRGRSLGPDQRAGLELTASGQVSATLARVRVLFDGIAAPLIYAESGQVSAVVPYSVIGEKNTQVQIEYQGRRSDPILIPIAAVAPGIFTVDSTGMGQGAILNQDGTPNSISNPASRGSVITLYGSGEGQTDPAGVDGAIAGKVLPKPLAAVSASVGDAAAEVLYAGAAPGMVAGIFQINLRIPAAVSPGNLPLLLTIGNTRSQPGVTVAVQ